MKRIGMCSVLKKPENCIKMKGNSSGVFETEFYIDEATGEPYVYFGMENSSGTKYQVSTIAELKEAFAKFVKDNAEMLNIEIQSRT